MANLNKVMLIGRLTRDPESRTFSNGGKVTKFGFAVNNRRRNNATGEWEDDPVFLDVDVFNRGETGKLADRAEQFRKGQQIFIEGHLKLDQWTTQDNQKRSKITVVVDNFQYLEPRADGGVGDDGGRMPQRSVAPMTRRSAAAPAPMNGGYDDPGPDLEPPNRGGEEEIPF